MSEDRQTRLIKCDRCADFHPETALCVTINKTPEEVVEKDDKKDLVF